MLLCGHGCRPHVLQNFSIIQDANPYNIIGMNVNAANILYRR